MVEETRHERARAITLPWGDAPKTIVSNAPGPVNNDSESATIAPHNMVIVL